MKPRAICIISLTRLFSLGFVPAFTILLLMDGPAGAQERVAPDLAEQYRRNVEERRSELRSIREDVQQIDDAVRDLRKEMAAENRQGRMKDLRSRIDDLRKRQEALNGRIERERQALSGAAEPDEAFRRLSAGDLVEREQEKEKAIRGLDGQIAALKKQLGEQQGREVRERNLQDQIEELSRRRDELASRPRIDPEDMSDAEAVEVALAERFTEAETRRNDELKRVGARIDDLQKRLAKEGRRVRRGSIEAMIAELKLRERELEVAPARRGEDEAAGEPGRVIERGLKREREQQERRVEVLNRRIERLREQLRVENRTARRKSIGLQIRELERARSGKSQSDFEPPPRKGFTGAPYGSAWDLDAEYKPPETSD